MSSVATAGPEGASLEELAPAHAGEAPAMRRYRRAGFVRRLEPPSGAAVVEELP